MDIDKERAAFEAWAKIEYRNTSHYTEIEYGHGWDAWQARAALASQGEPVECTACNGHGVEHDNDGEYVGKCLLCSGSGLKPTTPPAAVPAPAPTAQEIVNHLGAALRGFICPLCGKNYPHEHSPAEITIYRNGFKAGSRQEKLTWAEHQGAAEDAGMDAGATGASSGPGAHEHHEHREGQSSDQRHDGGCDGAGHGISGSGEVREVIAAAPAQAVDALGIKTWQERIGPSAVKSGCWNITSEAVEEIADLRAALSAQQKDKPTVTFKPLAGHVEKHGGIHIQDWDFTQPKAAPAEPVAYADPMSFVNFADSRASGNHRHHKGREWMWANPDTGLVPLYAAPVAAAGQAQGRIVSHDDMGPLGSRTVTAYPIGQAQAVAVPEPEPMSIDEAREYIVKFMEQHFTDKTFHRYIRGTRPSANLAGDFAWQMARALRLLVAAPLPQQVAQSANHDRCTHTLRFAGKPYPRTCEVCGPTGPCQATPDGGAL